MTGTIGSQLLLILFAPILSRLYSPDKFGDYAVFTSVMSVVSVLVTLKFELAIILPKKERDATKIIILSLIILIALTLMLSMIIILFRSTLNEFLNINKNKMYLLFVPITFFLIGCFQLGNYWKIRQQKFSSISNSILARSSVILLVQGILGFLGLGSIGLIIGRVMGEFCGTIIITHKCFYDWFKQIKKLKKTTLYFIIYKYQAFPKYSAPQALFNSLSQNIPILLLTRFFGISVAGLYSMAIRLVLLPLDFISQSVRQVFFEKASRTYREGGNVYNLFVKSTLGLAIIGIIPMITFVIWGPQIFSFLLGKEWELAGNYARILSFWLYFLFINPPTTALLYVFNKQKIFFIYDICLFFARAIALFSCGYYKNLKLALICYTLVGALANGFLITYVYVKVKNTKVKLCPK